MYNIQWFLYLVISFLLIIGLNVLLHFTVKKESTKETIIKIMAILTLFSHISIYYYNCVVQGSWRNVIPNDSTFLPVYPCNVAMMLYPVVYLFTGKARKFLLTFLAYYGFLGGMITMFVPDFYSGGNIFEWDTFKSFLSHSLLLLTSVYCFVSGLVKIEIKNIFAFIGGMFLIFLPVGLILNYFLDVNSMYLRDLPLDGVPLLTPYFISFLMVIVIVLFITIWDRFTKPFEKRWYHNLRKAIK
jgi:hypothetical protein